MTQPEAIAILIDATRQHRDSLGEHGRLTGLVDMYDEAIRVVEGGDLMAEETVQRRVA